MSGLITLWRLPGPSSGCAPVRRGTHRTPRRPPAARQGRAGELCARCGGEWSPAARVGRQRPRPGHPTARGELLRDARTINRRVGFPPAARDRRALSNRLPGEDSPSRMIRSNSPSGIAVVLLALVITRSPRRAPCRQRDPKSEATAASGAGHPCRLTEGGPTQTVTKNAPGLPPTHRLASFLRSRLNSGSAFSLM